MNNLNGLIPILYAALQVVSRELVGAIPAATRNMTADSAAVGQTIRMPVTPPAQNTDVVEGTKPTLAGTNFGYRDLVINKRKRGGTIPWTGNEQVEVGGQLNQILVNQYAQSMRSLINEVEADVCLELVLGAIEAGNIYGTPGATPFAANIGDLAQLAKILDDKGAPQSGRQLVANTAAGAALRTLPHLSSIADAGETDMLRRGVFNNLLGFAVRQSGGFKTINPGTGSGYLVNGAAGIGDTEVTVDTGSGIINRGAIVTFGADTTKYVVSEDLPSGGTVLKIAGGLKAAVADNAAIALGAAYLPSAGFTSDAIVLATRLPALPEGGDNAKDTYAVTDPVSGLSLQAALYGEYMQNWIELRLAWGVKTVNPRHCAVLIG